MTSGSELPIGSIVTLVRQDHDSKRWMVGWPGVLIVNRPGTRRYCEGTAHTRIRFMRPSQVDRNHPNQAGAKREQTATEYAFTDGYWVCSNDIGLYRVVPTSHDNW